MSGADDALLDQAYGKDATPAAPADADSALLDAAYASTPAATRNPWMRGDTVSIDPETGRGVLEAGLHFASEIPAGMLRTAGQLVGEDSISNRMLRERHAPNAPTPWFSRAADAITYEPRSDVGRAIVGVEQIPKKAGEWVTDKTGIPELGAAAQQGVATLPLVPAMRAKPGAAPGWATSPQSMGAAASSTAQFATASPELQAAVRASKNPNMDAAVAHAEAERLGLPPLTRGQATGDPIQISLEQNRRGAAPDIARRLDEQNRALGEKMLNMRDEVGPDVFSTTPTQHGDTLIGAYRAVDDARNADIATKYKALEDANGGHFPVDFKAIAQNAAATLHKKLLTDHAPAAEMRSLQRLADEGGTFEDFEALRTNLAEVMRSSTNGNERKAASVMREAMENLPLQGNAAQLKPLADAARAAARERFAALEADPAYKAAVTESVAPDDFVRRFIVNGKRDNLATMRETFADNPQAQQTMGVAALDHLRGVARIDAEGKGNFAAASFDKHLTGMQDTLRYLLPPEQVDQLTMLSNYAKRTTALPRGNTVSTSGTTPALLHEAASAGKSALEHGVNMKAGGLPIGTIGRKLIEGRELKKFSQDALAPYAGIESPR